MIDRRERLIASDFHKQWLLDRVSLHPPGNGGMLVHAHEFQLYIDQIERRYLVLGTAGRESLTAALRLVMQQPISIIRNPSTIRSGLIANTSTARYASAFERMSQLDENGVCHRKRQRCSRCGTVGHTIRTCRPRLA